MSFTHGRLHASCVQPVYNVYYRDMNAGGPWVHSRTYSWVDAHTFRLSNLQPDTPYQIWLNVDCDLENGLKLRYKSLTNAQPFYTKCTGDLRFAL